MADSEFKRYRTHEPEVDDQLELEDGTMVVVDHLNGIAQPYVKRIDGKSIGVNDGKYLFDEKFRIVKRAHPRTSPEPR